MPRTDVESERAGWRSRDILRTAALVAGAYVALRLLWVGQSVFLLGFLGVLLGLTLSAGVDRLERLRVPRGLGAGLIVLAVLGVLTGLGWLAAPQAARQAREVGTQLPEAVGQVRSWIDRRVGGVVASLKPDSSASGARPGEQRPDSGQARSPGPEPAAGAAGGGGSGGLPWGLAGQVGQGIFTIFSSTLALLAGLILVIFVAIFVAADPGLYHAGLMHLFPHRHRAKAGEVLSAVATTLRRWLVAQMLAMLAIGLVTTAAMLLLGIKAAFALGLIAGVLEFIPYLGPILSAVPAIAMALADGPEKALSVVIAYTAIQQLEGVVLQPLLMKEGLEIPPVVTILGQALFGLVFGFLGLLIAVPLLGAVMVPIKLLYVRDVVGDEVAVPGEAVG